MSKNDEQNKVLQVQKGFRAQAEELALEGMVDTSGWPHQSTLRPRYQNPNFVLLWEEGWRAMNLE